MPSGTSSPNIWKAQLSGLVLLFTWGYSFWPAIKAIFTLYLQSKYDHHGLISIPIILWLFWLKTDQVNGIDPAPNFYGVILIALISIFSVIAFSYNFGILYNITIISILPLIFFSVAGINITIKMFLPLSFMIFLVPFGYIVIPYFFKFILVVLNIYLQFIQFGWYLQDQDELQKIYKLFFGIHYLIPQLLFLLLFSYFKLLSNKILFVVTGISLSIISNLIVVICILSIQLVTKLLLPWQLYKVVSVIACGVGLLSCLFVFNKKIVKSPINFIKRNDNLVEKVFWDPDARWFNLTVIIVCLLILPEWIATDVLVNPWTKEVKVLFDPPKISEWSGPTKIDASQWQPQFFGSTAQMLAAYTSRQREVWLYSAYYYKVLQAGGLIDSENKLYDDTYWNVLQTGVNFVPLFKKKLKLHVKEIVLVSEISRQLLWYWYYIGDTVSNDQDYMYMISGVQNIAHMQNDSGIIIVSTEFDRGTNIEEVRSRLIYFINNLEPNLSQIMHPKKI